MNFYNFFFVRPGPFIRHRLSFFLTFFPSERTSQLIAHTAMSASCVSAQTVPHCILINRTTWMISCARCDLSMHIQHTYSVPVEKRNEDPRRYALFLNTNSRSRDPAAYQALCDYDNETDKNNGLWEHVDTGALPSCTGEKRNIAPPIRACKQD